MVLRWVFVAMFQSVEALIRQLFVRRVVVPGEGIQHGDDYDGDKYGRVHRKLKLKKMFRPKTVNMSPSNERTMIVAIFIQYVCFVPRSVMRRFDWQCAN